MLAEIITIGDELLIGQVVDTNSAWLGQVLSQNGITVKQITSVSDDQVHILQALAAAEERAELILITGGLGPTKDDITKQTLCTYFNTSLVFNTEVLADVEERFASFGKTVTPINRKQAEVPANCKVIRNKSGTAPGMWIDKGNKTFISMPGVPFEMKAMVTNSVIALIKEKFKLSFIYYKTVLTQGIGESDMAELIEKWEDSLAALNIKLAYLPSIGTLRLRLTTHGDNEAMLRELVTAKITELQALADNYIYGYEEMDGQKETLQHIVGQLLLESNQTLAIAESCTGGFVSHLITSIPGSSAYFKGGIITYANEIKTQELSIPAAIINQHGAVSSEVVELMAKEIKNKFKTDYAIATSGIAGPSGGSAEKPVGTIWIAIATQQQVITQKFLFGGTREQNIERTAQTALNMLRKHIVK
jgi:nicotinamide-nucleotide amidase